MLQLFGVSGKNGKEFFIIFIGREDIFMTNVSCHNVVDFNFVFYSGYPGHK